MFNVSRMRKAAAPVKVPKDPQEVPQQEAPQEVPQQEEQKPSMGASPMSGWVDLKKAHKDIGDLLKNPAGKEVEVKSVSKAGVHTFTITVKPTEMMQRAEQNGGVQQPGQGAPQGAAGPAPTPNAVPGPGPADMQQQEQVASAKKNVKVAAINLKDAYPESFLKMIGL